ncbi:MAG: NFACT family protein, partial [Candidatus Eisenbacteria bacterium]
MDSIVLSRLAPAWREELVGAAFAGIRPAGGGLALVFDRAPEGARPGRRSVLTVRLAAPVWAWTAPQPAGAALDWTFRLPAGATLAALDAPAGDRRVVLDLGPHRIHLELWPPGNVLVEEAAGRLVWCARTRPASSFRGELAPDRPYAAPAPPLALDPLVATVEQVAAWFASAPPEAGERLARLARDFAGLPKGLLEALAPSLPRGLLTEGAIDSAHAPALAREFVEWVRASYAEAPPVRGYAWNWPSPGTTLLTRALAPGGEIRFVATWSSWPEAARELAGSLPAPVDATRIAAARAALKRLERAEHAVLAQLEEAARAGAIRAQATALASFLPRVTRGASEVSLPDPAEPATTLVIALDPKLKPHENVDRLFKRAGKLERVAEQAPARLAELRKQIERARLALAAAERGEAAEARPRPRRAAAAGSSMSPEIDDGKKKRDKTPSALVPRRYRTVEGWEVLIGKNNQGNDHLTHRLARPEDYWMHVHGAAG